MHCTMDLALFVKRQLDGGMTRADIARRLGKALCTSPMCAGGPPDWLVTVYRAGKCGLRDCWRRFHDLMQSKSRTSSLRSSWCRAATMAFKRDRLRRRWADGSEYQA
jgi:hypothetical protein